MAEQSGGVGRKSRAFADKLNKLVSFDCTVFVWTSIVDYGL